MKLKAVTFAAVLLGAAATVTGCGKLDGENVTISPTIAKSFTMNADLKYGENTADVNIAKSEDGVWTAEFLSPNTLAGVILSFDDSNVSANYRGLEFSVPKAAMPYETILTGFIGAANDLASAGKIEAKKNDLNYIVEGANDQGEYTILLDRKTGTLSGYRQPNIALEMTISDYVAANTKTPAVSDPPVTETLGDNVISFTIPPENN